MQRGGGSACASSSAMAASRRRNPQLPLTAAAASAAGLEPDPENWHVARSIFVANTDAEAERFVKTENAAYDYYYRYLFAIFDRSNYRAPFVANVGDDPAKLAPEGLRDTCVIHGSPDTVARKLLELREEIGHFGTLLYAAHDWQEKALMRNSMRLMAQEVMPRVNQALRAKAA